MALGTSPANAVSCVYEMFITIFEFQHISLANLRLQIAAYVHGERINKVKNFDAFASPPSVVHTFCYRRVGLKFKFTFVTFRLSFK